MVDELNRLANGGGAYPARGEYRGEAGAANEWAGTSGLEVLHALNAKASVTSPGRFLGLWGVCNKIAGTSGLSAVDALRTIA